MKSYLESMLAARHMKSSLATFTKEHPGDWLVWEPGAFKPADSSTREFARPSLNATPSGGGEALALQLSPQPKLVLGRELNCDLVVNDATLSAEHLIFARSPAGEFTVEDARSRHGSTLNGLTLEPGKPQALKNGDKIVAAQAKFTFMTAEGFLARLQGK